jgi:hypothetical protein
MMDKRLACFLTFALALGGARRAAADDAGEEVALALASALRRVEARSTSAESAGRELAGLGADIVPVVLRVLDGGVLPGEPEGLEPEREAILLSALTRLDRTTVVERLTERFDAGALGAETALRVLGAVGHARDLDLLCRVADDASAHATEAAVARILVRDDGAWALVQRKIRDGSPEITACLLGAVSSLSSPRGLQLFDELLGLLPALDHALVSHIGTLGAKVPWAADERLRAKVREQLRATDTQLVRGAAMTLGALEDSGAMETLLELLESDSTPVRGAAHWALKRITRLELPNDSRRWRSWYTTECHWFEASGSRLLDRLHRLDGPWAFRALEELSAHRFKRDLVSFRIEALLVHADPIRRKQACVALGRLASRTSIPALQAAVTDRDASSADEDLSSGRAEHKTQ